MGIRDEEIKRLIYYAKGLGIKVTFSNKQDENCAAEWRLDGTEIIIYKRANTTKISTIMSLIHELGHHAYFVHEKDRQPDLKFEEAILRQSLVEEGANENPTPKHLRKKIYDMELASTYWWESIYKETNMQFPIWRLYFEMEYDVWTYEYFYEYGVFPKSKERRQKRKDLRKRYG